MPPDIISWDHIRLREVRRLRYRKHRQAEQRTVLEGPHLLEAAIKYGCEITTIIAYEHDEQSKQIAEEKGIEFLTANEFALSKVSPSVHPRGPLAVAKIPTLPPPDGDCLWLAPRDPGNAGTLIRSAAAFGMGVVWKEEGTVDLWSPKVLRAGAGAHFQIKLESRPLESSGFTLGLSSSGGITPIEWLDKGLSSEPVLILVGDESNGLTSDQQRRADQLITIPMQPGIESLNTAVAASIMAYELDRYRRKMKSEANRQ